MSSLNEVIKETAAAAEELLTVEEVATWLRVKPAWVRAHANGNRNPNSQALKWEHFADFGGHDILRFLEELSKTAASVLTVLTVLQNSGSGCKEGPKVPDANPQRLRKHNA